MTRKINNPPKKVNIKNPKQLVLILLSILLFILWIIFFTNFSFSNLVNSTSDSINNGFTKYIEVPLRKNKAGFEYYSKIINQIGEPKTLSIDRSEDKSQKWNGYHMSRYYYGSGDREVVLAELIKKVSSLGFSSSDNQENGAWFNPKFYPEKYQESRWTASCNEANVQILVKEQKKAGEPQLLVRVYVYGNRGGAGENCPDL